MRSKVAEETRQDLDRQMLAMTPAERIEIAFALGERDLQLYMAANEVTREEALAHFRHESQARVGRIRNPTAVILRLPEPPFVLVASR